MRLRSLVGVIVGVAAATAALAQQAQEQPAAASPAAPDTPAATATDAPAAPAAAAPEAPAAAPEASAKPKKEKKPKREKTAKLKKGKIPPTPPVSYVVPPQSPENMWDLDLSTGGKVVVQLRPDEAPDMVARIRQLSCSGFYDGLPFHRVIEGFMAQGGDPLGTGEGGSTLPDVAAEFNDLPHVRGAVAAARAASEDSANSQFYIMLQPNLRLDKHYTVLGRVVSGMAYVDAIPRGEPPANPARIQRATIEGGCAGVQIVNARPAALAPTAPAVKAPANPFDAAPDDSPGTGPAQPGS